VKLTRSFFVLLCTVFAFTAAGAVSASATDGSSNGTLAYEQDFAKDVDWTDTDKDCRPDGEGAKGCVQAYGDVLWLLDRWSDGHGVSMTWQELQDDGGYRSGKCIDNLGSAAGWTVCDKDFEENSLIWWQVQWWENGAWQESYLFQTIV
jgi:hypothetical protein